MGYNLSTNVLTQILEETSFSQTINVTKEDLDPPITSIVVTLIGDTNGDINITTDNSTNFTIAGSYNNNFNKVITFLDANKVSQTISSKTAFLDLPAGYWLMTEYLASTSTSFTASYDVKVNGISIDTVTQQVNNNYTPGRDSLISAVAGAQV